MKATTPHDLPTSIDPRWKIGIVASTYHKEHVDTLVDGAKQTLIGAGIPADHVTVHSAPGSFEVPLIGAALAEKRAVDALVGFGIIVKGETHHADLLADAVTHGIMDVQMRYRIPFAFEILYVDSIQQAIERTHGEANKGIEAARAVLHALRELQNIGSN